MIPAKDWKAILDKLEEIHRREPEIDAMTPAEVQEYLELARLGTKVQRLLRQAQKRESVKPISRKRNER